MLRILHVPCDLAGGGAERLVLDLCRRSSPGFQHAVAPVHATGPLRAALAQAGVPIHDLHRRRGRPGLRAVLRLARLVGDFDVVHTHLWAGDTWGRLGAALGGQRRVLCTEHNTRPEDPWRQRLSVALHPLCRAVVGVSEAAAGLSLQAGVPGAKVRVIPNGVDLTRFVPRPPLDRPPRVVLGVGRLAPQKGFDLLARAVRRVPGLRLELVGEGPQAEALAAEGARLHGWVPDVAPLLAAADVVAIPSRWEGFGLVAVEAMASGVPVIASAIPGLDEVVGDAALRVPPEDVDALARALGRLAEEPDLRRRLAGAGPARAAGFSIERTVQAYEALYRELVAAR
ncbi:glycosyltransferase [Myxococcota bacterium]|nr:glycosyltransferase [Myxococcota bacterium]